MPFRLKKTSREFFKHIDKSNKVSGFKLDFDMIYFCFMASMAEGGRKEQNVLTVETTEVENEFPGDYRGERGRMLVGLLLAQELKSNGVEVAEKKPVNKMISQLIDPESPSRLTEAGFREFNHYVFGGDAVLREWFDIKPQSLEIFLRQFKLKIDNPT